MSIKVTCDECFTTLTVGSQHAGKVAKCKTCGAKVRIPAAADEEDVHSTGPALSAAEVEALAPRPSRPKPAAKKKSKPARKSSSDGSWTRIKSALVVIVVVALFGLRVAGRISRHWKGNQANQQQSAPGYSGASVGQASPFGGSPFGATPSGGDPSELYSLTDGPIQPPEFSPANFTEMPGGVSKCYLQTIATPGASDGTLMVMGVYLPRGEHAPGSLPCILFAPAGTPMIHGNPLDGNPNNPEFVPYLRAGFAVVEFSLDGWYDSSMPSDAKAAAAYRAFSAAHAGVKNADAAFRFAQKLPAVNPNQIYIAGHSSAGALALLYAAHQPQLAGCLAYAPQVDVEGHLREAISDPRSETALPGIHAFVKRSSPDNHVSQIRVPVFAFHATQDDVTWAAKTRKFCDQLRQGGKDVKFVEVPGSDHYQTMISPGLQSGIEWLNGRLGKTVLTRNSSPADAAAPGNQAATPMESPFKPSRAPASSPDFGTPPASPFVTRRADESPFKRKEASDGGSPATSATLPAEVPSGFRMPVTPPPADPPQTKPVEAESSLVVGGRVIVARGPRWVGAEVVEVLPGQQVKVHFLNQPAAIDQVMPWTHVRLPLAESAISKDAIDTLRFNLIRVPDGGVSAAKQTVESELLALEGYLPGSLEIDTRTKRVSVKIVVGSSAETEAKFALLRGHLFTTPFAPTRRR